MDKLVFDPQLWGGKDKGDNSQFWKPATILGIYQEGKDVCADVRFHHDGRISRGHFVEAMREVGVMNDSREDDDMPEEARVVGPILMNQEMAIKIAGLAQHATSKAVMLTQEVPKDRLSPQIMPIKLARSHSLSEHLEWWELTVGRSGSAEARLLEQEELDEP